MFDGSSDRDLDRCRIGCDFQPEAALGLPPLPAEHHRFGVDLDPESPTDVSRVRLRLKNSSLQQAGYLEIRAAGGQEVEIANCSTSGAVLARVTLSANGDIRLAPAPDRQIVLDGPLEAQRVSYLPQAGGVRQTL